MNNYYLTNQNDIYLYFELIEQIEPRSILDIGMFLKRTGATSRQALELSFSSAILLEGIDFKSNISSPIYHTIYDTICDYNTFLLDIIAANESCYMSSIYELCFLINPRDFISLEEELVIWRWLQNHCSYVVTTSRQSNRLQHIQQSIHFANSTNLNVNNDTYKLIQLS